VLALRRRRRSAAIAATVRCERGQNLVEFAMVTPLLVLFLCGIFEFGNILMTQQQIQTAVREGARWASLSSCPTDAAIQTKVQTAAVGLPITISSSYSPSPCSNCPTVAAGLPTLTINGSYTYAPITPIGAVFHLFGSTFSNSLSLTSSSTLANEC